MLWFSLSDRDGGNGTEVGSDNSAQQTFVIGIASAVSGGILIAATITIAMFVKRRLDLRTSNKPVSNQ